MPTLEWIGKSKVINHHQEVPFRVLERKYSFDENGQHNEDNGSENMIIRGDNLEALKALLPRYEGRVKCIYIDPPYNTGNEGWVYNDNVNDPKIKKWLGEVVGKEGEDLTRHDKWLCMMYPRLKLLQKLLADDGVIFISIDDTEISNLRLLMDEVFGVNNFVTTVIWHKNYAPKSSAKFFSEDHDYITVYAKNKMAWIPNLLPRTEEQDKIYKNPDNDPRGLWRPDNLSARNPYSLGLYSITCPGGRVIPGPPAGRYWVVSEEKFKQMDAEGRIYWGKDGNNIPAPKRYLSEVKQGRVPQTIWEYEEVGHTQDAKKDLKSIFTGEMPFDTPKPYRLIERILQIASDPDSIILDSFAGSGTTAHAVLNMNKADGGHRKFIMVQLPEACDEKSEAYKAGYKNICEIGKERIRRAAKKIREDAGLALSKDFDGGFRCLRLDSSNMQDVYYTPDAMRQDLLSFTTDNIKPDRTPEDLLFQVMLELGVLPSSKITETVIGGKKVFDVADGFLLACFDKGVTTETVTAIAKKQPYYAVFRDASMADDSTATNFDQIFETYSPSTVRKVL